MAGQLTLSGTQTGIPSTSRTLGITFPTAMSTNEATLNLALANGDNTVTIPGGAGAFNYAIIIPPTANANALKLKGAAGDTGILILPATPSVLSLGSTLTTFIINAGAAVTGETAVIFC